MNIARNLQPIYIVGPTASGKSALAVALASEFDSVIISADSMQIYRGLDVGTAKESLSIRNKIEHKLIDILDYDEEFSVAEYARLARAEIESAQKRNKLPIIVGGTGLYFEALLYPMNFANTTKNTELRAQLENDLEKFGAKHLHDRLRDIDSESADRLHENDVKRVIRALEIVLTTGKTLKENADNKNTADSQPNVVMVGLNTERAKLYQRINDRVDKMFANGLVNEVLSVGRFDCQSMQAIGYKEFVDCKYNVVDGNFVVCNEQLAEIKDKIKQHSRNYAKRQLTWFRKYGFVKWFDCDDVDGALEYLRQKVLQPS